MSFSQSEMVSDQDLAALFSYYAPVQPMPVALRQRLSKLVLAEVAASLRRKETRSLFPTISIMHYFLRRIGKYRCP
jgi:hypothetical protein